MQFDWTINFGTILAAASVVAGLFSLYAKVDKRLAIFQNILERHADQLEQHGKRMEQQDRMLLELTGNMQRVFGQLDFSRHATDQRGG